MTERVRKGERGKERAQENKKKKLQPRESQEEEGECTVSG